MSKYTDSPVIVIINEDVLAASFISLHFEKNEKSEKQDIVTNV